MIGSLRPIHDTCCMKILEIKFHGTSKKTYQTTKYDDVYSSWKILWFFVLMRIKLARKSNFVIKRNVVRPTVATVYNICGVPNRNTNHSTFQYTTTHLYRHCSYNFWIKVLCLSRKLMKFFTSLISVFYLFDLFGD